MKTLWVLIFVLLLTSSFVIYAIYSIGDSDGALSLQIPRNIRGGDDVIPDHKFSVVIVNYNEQLLWKTVEKIIDNTAEQYLGEILIIDDCSEDPVTNTLNLPYVNIIRSDTRLGLIQARNLGGSNAKYPLIAMIDAHVYVAPEWLSDPYIQLTTNYRRIVVPIVTIMPQDQFILGKASQGFGSSAGFSWNFKQFWGGGNKLTKESAITMGQFFITKRWWDEIRGMDDGMKVWGGENVDISLKCWLCGGEIIGSSKSVVSHYFRKSFPYSVDHVQTLANYARIAEVWLDEESRQKFYEAIKFPKMMLDIGDISKQKELKEQLNCKPFSWYLEKFKGISPCGSSDDSCGKVNIFGLSELPPDYQ